MNALYGPWFVLTSGQLYPHRILLQKSGNWGSLREDTNETL